MFRKIYGLMFALLISVSVFAIDFDVIRGRYESDSLGLDSAAYDAVLVRMLINEGENEDHYKALGDSLGMQECKRQMKSIIKERLSLSGADSTEIADIESEEGGNGLIVGISVFALATLEGLRRWRAKRKALKEVEDAVV